MAIWTNWPLLLTRFFGSPLPKEPSIAIGADGFSVANSDRELASVQWRHIARVLAFKQDWGAYDEICLAIEHGDPLQNLVIGEACDGYQSLLECLELQLPNFRRGWWCDVAFPAFATNLTVLFEREPLSSPC
jgi:hypothetical protein